MSVLLSIKSGILKPRDSSGNAEEEEEEEIQGTLDRRKKNT